MFKVIFKIINFFIIIGVLIGIYAFFIEPKLLVSKINKINLDKLNKEITIIHFSDTHLSANYNLRQLEKLIDNINAKNPDIILFTGDLIDKANTYTDIGEVSSVLKKMNANLGKFAVYGNHDIGGGGIKVYEQIMTESNFVLLKNESFLLKINESENINIIGLDDANIGNPDYNISNTLVSEESINLLMTHAADPIDNMNLSKISVVFSGHSHGGQVSLPIIKEVVLPKYGQKYIKGSYKIGDSTTLYVSSGVGTTRIPIRFLNPPEFIIHTIK